MDCNFSHDGKLVVSGSDLDRTIKIWDATAGTLIKEIAGNEAHPSIFLLAFVLGQEENLWNLPP